jgi:hypothetical protein
MMIAMMKTVAKLEDIALNVMNMEHHNQAANDEIL